MFRTVLVLSAAFALGGCGKAATESDNPQPGADAVPEEQAVAAASQAAAAETPASFAQCRTCHSIEPERQMIGPSLAGIHGKPSGERPVRVGTQEGFASRLAIDALARRGTGGPTGAGREASGEDEDSGSKGG